MTTQNTFTSVAKVPAQFKMSSNKFLINYLFFERLFKKNDQITWSLEIMNFYML